MSLREDVYVSLENRPIERLFFATLHMDLGIIGLLLYNIQLFVSMGLPNQIYQSEPNLLRSPLQLLPSLTVLIVSIPLFPL